MSIPLESLPLKMRNKIYKYTGYQSNTEWAKCYSFSLVGETWEGGSTHSIDLGSNFRNDFVLYMGVFYTKEQFLESHSGFKQG